MRDGIETGVSAAGRARLEAVAADRDSRQEHVRRARVVPATADGTGTGEAMRRPGVARPCVRPSAGVPVDGRPFGMAGPHQVVRAEC
jgi:hypothetical protein